MIDGVRTIGKVNIIPCMYTATLSLSQALSKSLYVYYHSLSLSLKH